MSEIKEKRRAVQILDKLKQAYPIAEPALEYQTPFQLLISTILSAQCTDARVNVVTKSLFKKYLLPDDFIKVPNSELEKDIFSTGFYKQKAKSIKNCCTMLIEKYNGNVPEDFDELIKLPGVGRKTASVVAGNAFGVPAIAVDTHVIRLSNLFGFVNTKNPEVIEKRLKELFPEKDWVDSSHLIATHGRNICIARKPKCFECFLIDLCPGFISNKNLKI
ncbi:endonuclease III [Bacteroidota bacterium]